jgi:hypothetical protein
MGGPHKFAMLPLMAGALFAFGCGMPMAPEHVAATSTAEAIQQRQNTDAQLAGQGGPEIRTASTDGSGASSLASTPLPTREAALSVDGDMTPTAAPEGTALAATATVAPAVATAAPAPINSATFTQDFVGLLNALRAGRGLGVVTLNGALTTASNTFASYMGSSNFFGHYGRMAPRRAPGSRQLAIAEPSRERRSRPVRRRPRQPSTRCWRARRIRRSCWMPARSKSASATRIRPAAATVTTGSWSPAHPDPRVLKQHASSSKIGFPGD